MLSRFTIRNADIMPSITLIVSLSTFISQIQAIVILKKNRLLIHQQLVKK